MKKISIHLLKVSALLLLVLSFAQANAQVATDFQTTIRNVTQTSDRILEFDLYLLNNDASDPMELATYQAGITVNPAIYAGGTLSASIVSGTSSLMNTAQVPTSVTYTASANIIKLAAKSPPGPGAGSIISQTSPGTRIIRLRLTSTVDFATNTTPDLFFAPSTAVSPSYATRVALYVGTSNNQYAVTMGVNAFVLENPVLNPASITAYAVTGSGSYCQGETGLPVGLSDSETGITYTIYKNSVAQAPTVAGTGSAISFGNQLSGTYTATGSNSFGSTNMTGSAVIAENPLPDIGLAVGGSSSICSGTSTNVTIALSVTGTEYQLRDGTTNIGTPVSGDGGTISIPTGTVSSTTTYNILATITSTGCSAQLSGTATITTISTSNLSSTLTPGAICSATNFSYSAASAAPGATFTWSRATVAGITEPGTSGNGNVNEVLTNTTSSPIVVTYTYTTIVDGCSNVPENVVVTVNPTPVLNSTLTPDAICSASTFSYAASSATSGATFAWSRATVAGISQPGTSGTGNVSEVLTNTSTGAITVTYTYTTTANLCSNTGQNVTVTVNPIPVLSSSLTPDAFCSSTTFNYTPVSTTAGATFEWSRATVSGISQAGTTGSGSVSEVLTNTTISPILVTYIYTTTANQCSNSQNVVVTVNPTPSLSSSLTPPAISSGSTFNYIAGSSTSGATYSWSRATIAGITQPGTIGTGNVSEVLNNTTIAPIIVTYEYITSANGCSSSSQNVVVSVNPSSMSILRTSLENVVQTSDRTLTFDLYLLNNDPVNAMEMASYQAGITLNPSIFAGGTLTASIVAGTSTLSNPAQIPGPANILFTAGSSIIKLSPKAPPGAGGGSIISQTSPGTRIIRIQLTSTVPFAVNTTPNFHFAPNTALNPSYPTKVNLYLSGINTLIPITDGVNAFVLENPLLNPAAPTAYAVSGGGAYCQGSPDITVGVANSENNTTYTLYKNGVAQIPTVSGTGSAISFGIQTAGSYTVSATNTIGTTTMTGTAVITETEIPTATISYSGTPFCTSVSLPQAVTLSGTGAYTGGVYTANAGLSINTSNGEITPGLSTAGTYTVTYTVAASGGCAALTVTTSVTITALPVATFSYPATPYCSNAVNPSPAFSSGGVAGIFSSTAGLEFISAATGEVNLAASTPGTYTVTNTIAAFGGCAEVTASALITITALPTASIAYAGTPFCTSVSLPQAVTLSGTGAYAGGVYSANAGLSINTSNGEITPGLSTAGTYTVTYTVAASGGCAALPVTTSVTITALPVATFSYPATPYCSNAVNPSPAYSGGGVAGIFSSTAGLEFISAITGEVNLAASTPGTYTVTNTIAASGGCAEVTASAPITITVLPTASIAYAGTPFCESATPGSVSFTGTSGGLFTALPTGLTLDASTGTITPATSNAGTYTITYTVEAAAGCEIVTTSTSVTIFDVLSASISGGTSPICYNTAPGTFTATGTGGNGSYTYLWFKDGVTTGVTAQTYAPGNLTATVAFYCEVTSGSCGTVSTSTTTITVYDNLTAAISGGTSPICYNTAPGTFTATGTGGNGSYTYLWFKDGVTTGVTTQTYAPGNLTATAAFYCEVTSGSCGTVSTSTTTITVYDNLTAAISGGTSPICYNTAPGTFTATGTGGNGTYTYLWFKDGVTTGVTTQTYAPGNLTATAAFYCEVTSGSCGTVSTSTTTITVYDNLTAAISGGTSPICYNTAPGTFTATGTGGNGSYTYLWFKDGVTTGVTTQTYAPGNLTATAAFYCEVTSGSCGTVNTATSTIAVDPATVAGTVASAQTICEGNTPSDLVLSGSVGSVVKWQKSSDASFTAPTDILVTSTTLAGATIGSLTVNTYFRAVVQSGVCSSVNSTSVLITVNPTSAGGVIASAQSICGGTSPADLALSGYTGIVLKWQKSTDAAFTSPIDIAETSSTLSGATIGILTTSTYFRAVVQNGICPSVNSSAVLISVSGFVGDWVGTTSTDWFDPTNWCSGIPTNTTDVIIPAGVPFMPAIGTAGAICKNITIDALASLTLNATGTLSVTGNFLNNGTFTAGSGTTLIMNGTAAQTIAGGVVENFGNLTINNNLGVTLLSNVNVNSTLALNAGALEIGANTLGINGPVNRITGLLNASSVSSINIGGTGSLTLPTDLFSGEPSINNLAISKSVGVTLGNQNMTVNGLLNLASGTFNIGANSLTIAGNSPIRNTGNIDAGNLSATLIFANPSPVSLPASIFNSAVNNLTINGIGGVTAGSDFTVNGILNLAVNNPTATKGLLEMTISYDNYPGTLNTQYLNSYILHMGPDATTIGSGDVTGTVKRTATFAPDTPYSFGNEYSTIALTDGGVMPEAIAVSITIGNTPPGKPDAIRRTYEIVPTGGSACNVTANFHYLDAELLSSINPPYLNTELTTVTWDYDIGGTGGSSIPDEHGRSAYDFTHNFIGLSNIPISYFIQTGPHDWRTLFTLGDFQTAYYVWDGSTSTEWGTSQNWTPVGVPSDVSHVIIPDASTTPNDPILPAGNTTINTISIQSGGILIMGNNSMTIKNSLSGGWEDLNPTGNDPGTSTVYFIKPGTSVSGHPWFYNVEIEDGADVTNQTGTVMKLSNVINRLGTGKWYVDLPETSVEYNGAVQTVVTPDGSGHYHDLILSGSGVKTMPVADLIVHGNFTQAGSSVVTANSPITAGGNFILGAGTTFTAGNFTHNVGGNFENNGSTLGATGSTFNFNGLLAQNIGGSSITNFNNLTLNNAAGAQLGNSQFVNGVLTLTNGRLRLGSNNLNLGTAPVDGTLSASNMLVTDGNGEVRRSFTSNSSYTFPVGDMTGTTEYSPLTLTFTTGSYSSAYAGVRVTNAKHPNNASTTDFLNRFWSVTSSGITAFSCNLAGTYTNADISGTEGDQVTGKFSGALPWTKYATLASNTLSANGLTSFSDFTGIKAAVPIVTISANPAFSVCLNTPVTLTANPVGDPDFTYVWSPNGETTSSISVTTSTPGSTGYSVTATDGNGFSATDNLIVTVNPLPAAVAGADRTICENATTTLGAEAVSGSTYSWTSIPAGFTSTEANPAITALSTTTYTVIETFTATGCTNSNSVLVTVTPTVGTPVFTSGTNSTRCQGSGTVAYSATATNNTGITYSLDATSLLAGNSIVAGTGIVTYVAGWSGTSVITATAAGCNGPALAQHTVTVNPLLPVSVSIVSTSDTICSGTSVTFTASPVNGGLSPVYQWKKGGVDINGETGSTYTTSTLANGDAISVILTSNAICPDSNPVGSNTITITVHPLPTATISGGTSICAGTGPVTLTVNLTGTSPWSITYTDGITPVTVSAINSSPYTFSVNPAFGTTNTFSVSNVTDANNCSNVGTGNTVVIVYPVHIASTVSSQQSICYGASAATLTATAASGGSGSFVYQWQISTDNASWADIDDATGLLFNPGNLFVTTYYRIVSTDVNCGSMTSNVITITVHEPFNEPVIGSPQTICNGDTPLELSGTHNIGSNVYIYQWQSSTTPLIPSSWSNVNSTSLVYQPGSLSVTTTFRLIAIDNGIPSCGAVSSNEITMTVQTVPTPGTIGSDQTICSGETPASLTSGASGTGSGVISYIWEASTDGLSWQPIVPAATSATYSPGSLMQTTQFRRKTISTLDGNNCESLPTSPVIITVQQLLAASVSVSGSANTVCSGTTVIYTATPVNGGTSPAYQWYNGLIPVGGNSPVYSYVPANGDVISVVMTSNAAPCLTGSPATSNSVVMTVNPLPTASISGSTTLCAGSGATISINLSGTSPWNVTYTDGSIPVTVSGINTSPYTFVVTPAAGTTTTYSVTNVSSPSVSCSNTGTGSAIITVQSVTSAGTIGADQLIASGTAPAPITSVIPGSGSGSISYTWESSIDDGIIWEPVPGITTEGYAPGILNVSTWFRRTTFSNQNSVVCSAISAPVKISVTIKTYLHVKLEGPLEGTGTMNNVNYPNIPLSQPYFSLPWNYSGTETVTAIPVGVVDWVLVELRQATAPELATTIMARRAAFIKTDGSIVDLDGISNVHFDDYFVSAGNNLYVIIRQRNHLAVMSSTGASFVGGVYSYDFTTGINQAYGGANGYKAVGSTFAMVSGDSDADGDITVLDFSQWSSNFGQTNIYLQSDIDIDGQVSVLDFSKWSTNFGIGTPVKGSNTASGKYKSQVPEAK